MIQSARVTNIDLSLLVGAVFVFGEGRIFATITALLWCWHRYSLPSDWLQPLPELQDRKQLEDHHDKRKRDGQVEELIDTR